MEIAGRQCWGGGEVVCVEALGPEAVLSLSKEKQIEDELA